jgi:hypothetical protein
MRPIKEGRSRKNQRKAGVRQQHETFADMGRACTAWLRSRGDDGAGWKGNSELFNRRERTPADVVANVIATELENQ